jgi:hypothetical protein
MKKFFQSIILFFSALVFSQNPCEYATQINDSLGTYKSTKEYLVYERNFAGNENYAFLSLINTNGTPVLSLQLIQKSNEFIKAKCMDASTKIIFQLMNGKFVSFLHNNEESCGSLVKVPETNQYTRINSGLFLFLKGSIEELKVSPISVMRLQTGLENYDFVMKKEFTSELLKTIQKPESYFIDFMNCIE